MTTRNWFEVDKAGLAKLIEDKGKVFLLHELVSNAWDTDSTRVEVSLEKVPGAPRARLIVKDDHPDGFKNLSHAYTLFAESEKKGAAEKRGRFNLGEKLVLALCIEARITTTTGTVVFDKDGRWNVKDKTKAGSIFEAEVKMTQAEFDEAVRAFKKVLPPNRASHVTLFQGEPMPARKPIEALSATLPTVLADDEGNLRKTQRKTTVEVYEVLPGETASIYEMGIPVVETGDKFHVNVLQKVPLTMERDNVPPTYLKLVRALVLDVVATKLDKETAAESWVTDALTSPDVAPEAVKAVITKRFGENVVSYDPSDPESNHKAAAHDYQVIHGGSLPKGAWDNVRKSGAVKPAGKVFPTYEGSAPSTAVAEADLTDGMRRVRKLAIALGHHLCDIDLKVRFFRGPQVTQYANYNRGTTTMGFNLSHLEPAFFEDSNLEEILDLLVHELGHHFESSHLSAAYHKAITKLAGKGIMLALLNPEVYR